MNLTSAPALAMLTTAMPAPAITTTAAAVLFTGKVSFLGVSSSSIIVTSDEASDAELSTELSADASTLA